MMTTTAMWPPGRTCGMVVTVNLDAESYDLHETTPDNLYGKFSYGRYGMRAGVWRLLDVFRTEGIKATFFVPALDAENNREQIEAVLRDGHEIAARGYAFENHGKLGEREAETLAKAHETLTRIIGSAPVGWRAPFGELSPATLGHLLRLGYEYDSSFQDDDFPYVMQGDGGKTLVELPQLQFLDDATLYAPRHSHNRVLKTWKEEFDAMYREGTFVNLTVHPRGDHGSGRAIRARIVGEFIHYALGHPGVQLVTCREMARQWKAQHPATEPLPAFPPT